MSTRTHHLRITLEELAIRFLTLDYFLIRKVMKKELRSFPSGKILDIGCGTGILCHYFSPLQYVGIDIDSDLIHFAQKAHPRYTFHRMDAGQLSFLGNSFSKAIFVGAIHHIDDKTFNRMCRKLQKVLKKGSGILAIEPIPSHWFNILGRLLRDHDRGQHILRYEDYIKKMKKYFQVKRAYKKSGGLIDYGVFVLVQDAKK